MDSGLAKPPNSLEVTWDGDAFSAEFRPYVRSAWSLWAVIMETVLMWLAFGGFIALPATLIAIYLNTNTSWIGQLTLALWPLIAVVWIPWQVHLRKARVRITLGANALRIRRVWATPVRNRTFALEDIRDVELSDQDRAVHLVLRDRSRYDLPLGGASRPELRWLAGAIEYAIERNARFWREEVTRAGNDREALQKLLNARAGR